MPIDIGKEMALPMDQIIGGPLQAIVKAQAMAASTTADFINNVGLTGPPENRVAQTVRFSFERTRPRPGENAAGEPVDELVTETVNLTVPLLTILNVPFIRVAQATIDFEAKISSQTVNTSENTLNVDLRASGGFFGVKVELNVTYNHKSTSSDTVNRSAVLTVHVEAVQDEMPGGLVRVLDILETAVNDAAAVPA